MTQRRHAPLASIPQSSIAFRMRRHTSAMLGIRRPIAMEPPRVRYGNDRTSPYGYAQPETLRCMNRHPYHIAAIHDPSRIPRRHRRRGPPRIGDSHTVMPLRSLALLLSCRCGIDDDAMASEASRSITNPDDSVSRSCPFPASARKTLEQPHPGYPSPCHAAQAHRSSKRMVHHPQSDCNHPISPIDVCLATPRNLGIGPTTIPTCVDSRHSGSRPSP